MKKNFIITLALAGALTACNNEEINTPQVGNNDDPVAVRLSAKTSPIVVTKSTGTVGDLEGSGQNVWNNQTVYIYSFPKLNPDYALTPLIEIENKKATVAADGTIAWADKKDVYFPQLAAYDFFGYHVDDAIQDPMATVQRENAMIYFDNVTIDGSQDLMIAKAELTAEQKESLLQKAGLENADEPTQQAELDKAFSAYTARRDVQPSMTFKHLLSRLQFKIYPGKEGAEAVKIKSIEVKSRATGKLVIAAVNDADRGFMIDEAIDEVTLSLKERDANGQMVSLTQGKYNTPVFGETDTEGAQTGTVVGESLLVAPQSEYDINIDMEQEKNGVMESTPFPAKLAVDKGFLAGNSYLVKITVFGVQQVEIKAELQGWQAGDDVILNPDDEF